MASWADDWQSVAGSTAPADRPRAEAAIAALYATRELPRPAVVWVPSPAAGVLAYAFASLGQAGVAGVWARGDVGNGANREFNSLAVPFGMEPAWAYRLASAVIAGIPEGRWVPGRDGRATPRWSWRFATRADAAMAALGLDGTPRVLALVRSAAGAPSHVTGSAGAGADDAGRLAGEAAEAVFGDSWPRLVGLFGRDLATSLFAAAARRVAHELLTDPARRRNALQAMQPGQWDAVTPALASARDVFGGALWRHREGRAEHEAQVESHLQLARSAGPWWALEHTAIACERPLVLRRDDRGRPHAPDGPAIAWADGLEAYAWHGVAVEPWVIREPGRITVAAIDGERNVEVRRVLVERFGEERLLREGGARLVHEDETGRLWRRDIVPGAGRPRWWGPDDEPVVMVEVSNSTPEPDGTRRTYFLRVPPTIATARDAVAWTFGLGAAEYRPGAES